MLFNSLCFYLASGVNPSAISATGDQLKPNSLEKSSTAFLQADVDGGTEECKGDDGPAGDMDEGKDCEPGGVGTKDLAHRDEKHHSSTKYVETFEPIKFESTVPTAVMAALHDVVPPTPDRVAKGHISPLVSLVKNDALQPVTEMIFDNINPRRGRQSVKRASFLFEQPSLRQRALAAGASMSLGMVTAATNTGDTEVSSWPAMLEARLECKDIQKIFSYHEETNDAPRGLQTDSANGLLIHSVDGDEEIFYQATQRRQGNTASGPVVFDIPKLSQRLDLYEVPRRTLGGHSEFEFIFDMIEQNKWFISIAPVHKIAPVQVRTVDAFDGYAVTYTTQYQCKNPTVLVLEIPENEPYRRRVPVNPTQNDGANQGRATEVQILSGKFNMKAVLFRMDFDLVFQNSLLAHLKPDPAVADVVPIGSKIRAVWNTHFGTLQSAAIQLIPVVEVTLERRVADQRFDDMWARVKANRSGNDRGIRLTTRDAFEFVDLIKAIGSYQDSDIYQYSYKVLCIFDAIVDTRSRPADDQPISCSDQIVLLRTIIQSVDRDVSAHLAPKMLSGEALKFYWRGDGGSNGESYSATLRKLHCARRKLLCDGVPSYLLFFNVSTYYSTAESYLERIRFLIAQGADINTRLRTNVATRMMHDPPYEVKGPERSVWQFIFQRESLDFLEELLNIAKGKMESASKDSFAFPTSVWTDFFAEMDHVEWVYDERTDRDYAMTKTRANFPEMAKMMMTAKIPMRGDELALALDLYTKSDRNEDIFSPRRRPKTESIRRLRVKELNEYNNNVAVIIYELVKHRNRPAKDFQIIFEAMVKAINEKSSVVMKLCRRNGSFQLDTQLLDFERNKARKLMRNVVSAMSAVDIHSQSGTLQQRTCAGGVAGGFGNQLIRNHGWGSVLLSSALFWVVNYHYHVPAWGLPRPRAFASFRAEVAAILLDKAACEVTADPNAVFKPSRVGSTRRASDRSVDSQFEVSTIDARISMDLYRRTKGMSIRFVSAHDELGGDAEINDGHEIDDDPEPTNAFFAAVETSDMLLLEKLLASGVVDSRYVTIAAFTAVERTDTLLLETLLASGFVDFHMTLNNVPPPPHDFPENTISGQAVRAVQTLPTLSGRDMCILSSPPPVPPLGASQLHPQWAPKTLQGYADSFVEALSPRSVLSFRRASQSLGISAPDERARREKCRKMIQKYQKIIYDRRTKDDARDLLSTAHDVHLV